MCRKLATRACRASTSRGVNHALEGFPVLPFEFLVLGYRAPRGGPRTALGHARHVRDPNLGGRSGGHGHGGRPAAPLTAFPTPDERCEYALTDAQAGITVWRRCTGPCRARAAAGCTRSQQGSPLWRRTGSGTPGTSPRRSVGPLGAVRWNTGARARRPITWRCSWRCSSSVMPRGT